MRLTNDEIMNLQFYIHSTVREEMYKEFGDYDANDEKLSNIDDIKTMNLCGAKCSELERELHGLTTLMKDNHFIDGEEYYEDVIKTAEKLDILSGMICYLQHKE